MLNPVTSQGKDRYPYPVGYKSVRTQNGVTYTMEILEGLKGPSFTVSRHQNFIQSCIYLFGRIIN